MPTFSCVLMELYMLRNVSYSCYLICVTVILKFPVLVVTEQLHQDVEVLDHHVPATEPAGAVPAARELLLPVPAGAAADPGHLLAHADHHRHPTHRGARPHCRQGRLRRLCE